MKVLQNFVAFSEYMNFTDLLNVHILFKCHNNENFPYGSSMNENYVISKLKSNLDRKEKNKFLKVIYFCPNY